MNSLLFKTPKFLLLVLVSASIFSACTLSDFSDDINTEQLTNEEIEAASQIMGQALSDDSDGLFSSLNDALANISSENFENKSRSKDVDDDDDDDENDNYSGRGNERNYQHSYNPVNGMHTVSFDRSIQRPNFQKNLSAVLTYIFKDGEGKFIVAPRINRERIETVDFTSSKTGSTINRFRNSEFSRADTFAIAGLSAASTILSLDGVHYGNGTFHGVTKMGDTFERTYVNNIQFLDIQINKDSVAVNNSLSQGVTGTLTYEMNIFKSNNGNETSKTVNGTIEMTGDGSALLRFAKIERLFKVNLKSGFVSDEEDDFEGTVKAVDIANNTITLSDDLLVILTERTEIDGDDGLETLEEVALALESGKEIIVEIEGYINPENHSEFFADEVEFEFADADDD
ncbi:MAG: hypothetical protein WC967_08785 [Balneolaceae bacterium]